MRVDSALCSVDSVLRSVGSALRSVDSALCSVSPLLKYSNKYNMYSVYCIQSNTIFYYSTYWLPVSAIRPSSGHYIKFKTGYTRCTLISRRMGCHDIYSSVKIVLQPWIILPEI